MSVDGPTAVIHDGIRGRKGAFDNAMKALGLLDKISRERAEAGEEPVDFGIDCSVMRSTLGDLELFCTDVLWRFPEIKFIAFGAVVPTGLGNRVSFASEELLTEPQMERMRSASFAARLRALAPPTVQISVTDNLLLRMHPDDVARGAAGVNFVQIEPDGNVRGMAIYEGDVGNLLRDPVAQVLENVRMHPHHPFVVERLGPVRTNQEWAAAARAIDWYFGTQADRVRISRRSPVARPQLQACVR